MTKFMKILSKLCEEPGETDFKFTNSENDRESNCLNSFVL